MTVSRKGASRTWPWLVLSLPVLAAVAAALLMLGGVVFNASGRSAPISPQERALLLDVRDLARGGRTGLSEPGAEQVSKVRFVDTSFELHYLYDAPQTPEAPLLSYSITVEPTSASARMTFRSKWDSTRVSLWIGADDIAVEERNDLYQWGDESRSALLRADGEPFGNVFVARKGQVVVYLLLAGSYFADSAQAAALLGHGLRKLDQAPYPLTAETKAN